MSCFFDEKGLSQIGMIPDEHWLPGTTDKQHRVKRVRCVIARQGHINAVSRLRVGYAMNVSIRETMSINGAKRWVPG